MVDTSKLLVRVEREIPYSKITMREKIEMAVQTEREDLLEAVATDKSLKVRRVLIDRARKIPDKILGEFLIYDEDKYIREEAAKRIISETLSSNYYGRDGINIVLSFLFKFFGRKFVLELDSYENKRRAISAIYLYYMKYGCYSRTTGSKLLVFHKTFNDKALYAKTSLFSCFDGYKDDEPWEVELYGVLEKLAFCKYVPEYVESIIEKKLLSDEAIVNIYMLKTWIEQTIPEEADENLKNNWINILAKTLYNLGDPYLDKNYRVAAKCRLIVNGGVKTELANAADETLAEIYNVTAENTWYTERFLKRD